MKDYYAAVASPRHNLLFFKTEQEYRAWQESCFHTSTWTEESVEGNFAIIRNVCDRCEKVVEEKRVFLGSEYRRCPVDPKESRCLASCIVEDDITEVFQKPCEPVRRVIESSGVMLPVLSTNLSAKEAPKQRTNRNRARQ